MEIPQLYQLYRQHSTIKTDTRKLQAGDIFFALKGVNYNGNNFAKEALSAGASYVIIDEATDDASSRIIKTADSLLTLQQLAKYHREQFNIPFLAITGSNGKTTTKELVHAVLSSAYRTCTTEGNLNNHIGIPLTLLKIKNDADMAVIEMGANNLKEIEGYCKYAQPTHGLITNFGKAHLEGFGGIEGVRKAKGELFNYIRDTGGAAFINADDEIMVNMSKGIKDIITYGSQKGSLKGRILDSTSFLEVSVSGDFIINRLKTKLVGEYNLYNILAAIAVGKYFNVPGEKIKKALENYGPSNSRSQLIMRGSNKIILDAYNANPSSMKAAIENFVKMEGENKVLMLGGMKELGSDSEVEHINLLALIDQHRWYKVILVGEEFKDIKHRHITFDNSLQAKEWFMHENLQYTLILIKGSRSIEMEKILE